jgi:type IV pilus assembly protein PilP
MVMRCIRWWTGCWPWLLPALAAAVIVPACGGDTKEVTRTRGIPIRPTPAAPAAAAAPAVATAQPSGIAAVLAASPRVSLSDQDFIESDENRDPFRSFSLTPAVAAPVARQALSQPVVAEKFSLEELKLIAIISGTTNPKAMFRDPNGIGNIVCQGEFISRSEAKIKQILSDRVVFELQDDTGGPEPRKVERVVMLKPTAEEGLRKSRVRVLSKEDREE